MDAVTLDRIVEAYFESPPDTTRLGLGLNTVFRILGEHEGVTIPSSQAGKGTSFDIYFPKIAWQVVDTNTTKAKTHESKIHDADFLENSNLAQSPYAPSLPADAGEVAANGKEIGNILLVDDEEMVARVTTIGLQKLGYRVITHMDSRKALADFAETPSIFDAVITDQIMPHMSGVRLARKINGIRPDCPVILMTGFRDSFNEQQAREAGISQIVLKPTSHRDLAELIEKVRLREFEGHS